MKFLSFFLSITLFFSNNCMNHKKKQLVTIFDIHGKFFQKNSDDVKNVMPTPYTMELYAKETEEKVYTINLTENTSRTSQLLTKEKLKSMFSLYDILKTKPKTLNRQQRKTLESANDFFILGDYFGTEDSAINHLKFLISHYCKPEDLSPRLDQSTYRYSTLELFEQGLITKDDVLPPFNEQNNTLGIDLANFNMNFNEFMACIPFLAKAEKNPEDLKLNDQQELIYEVPINHQGETILTRSIKPYESYKKFRDAKIIANRHFNLTYFNFSKLTIHTLEELSQFIKKLQSHPATCLNMSSLNIRSLEELDKLINHMQFTKEELGKIISINLNNNHLEKLPPLFYKGWRATAIFPNLKKVTAKNNHLTEVTIQTDPDFRCGKMLLALKNIHLNLAHNQLRRLPRIIEHTSHACGNRTMQKKQFAHFASLNLKDNPLSLKTRSLIRSPQNTFAHFIQKAAFYSIAHFLYHNGPIAKFFLLNDISHSGTIIIANRFWKKYKNHLVPNDPYNQQSATSLFCMTRLGSIITPYFLFFLSRYCNSKKIPTNIQFDRKNRCLEISEDAFALLYQSCKDVHQDTNTFHRMYRIWNTINVPTHVLQ